MKPETINNKKILISPLNWGFGHVARSIGLIHQLRSQNNQIFVACSLEQKEIYENYFDDLNFIDHNPYPFNFKGKGHFSWDLLISLPSLSKRRKLEHIECEEIVQEFNIDMVIADHRYGFYSKNAISIFVTHQLNLPVSGLESIIQNKHEKLLGNFNWIWILDYEDSRLAGNLSVNKKFDNVVYIGPYSRFTLYDKIPSKNGQTVLIASGPMPYAQQLVGEVLKSDSPDLILGSAHIDPCGLRLISDWKEQDQIIMEAKRIISRSGYSTIMDLEFLNCEAKLIPTPGQAEQEYLKSLLND